MYVFAPGAGCSGEAKLVRPGESGIFGGQVEADTEIQRDDHGDSCVKLEGADGGNMSTRQRGYNVPLKESDLQDLGHKNFSPETMKKVKWVTGMYRDWRNYRNNNPQLESIDCDLDEVCTITEDSLIYAVTRFLTEVKKLDGTDFPGKTLYGILVCVQFHLETLGIVWKLLNNDVFHNVKFTLDNLMKIRAAQGLGISVKKAQILMSFDEEYLWSLGLLGTHCPEVLLNTLLFMIGKGCALCAAKEHYPLRVPPFSSQFSFMTDEEGQIFVRYKEELGFKTNKGGIKHRKIEPKEVDVYPVENPERCPVRILLKYLSVLPPNRNCKA